MADLHVEFLGTRLAGPVVAAEILLDALPAKEAA